MHGGAGREKNVQREREGEQLFVWYADWLVIVVIEAINTIMRSTRNVGVFDKTQVVKGNIAVIINIEGWDLDQDYPPVAFGMLLIAIIIYTGTCSYRGYYMLFIQAVNRVNTSYFTAV